MKPQSDKKEINKLIGKTIKKTKLAKHRKDCDSLNVLLLEMTDGSKFRITGRYGGYTGESCDEYIEIIDIEEVNI